MLAVIKAGEHVKATQKLPAIIIVTFRSQAGLSSYSFFRVL